ncbi:hypothetical protein [Brevibacillus sp. AY1]|uniref:hypothetical protein n=1 Tax=Brevibacillus sp. AY1 TaxID=2807621 RepID=UPI002454C4B9|nr:hypothetical protein [Brevibacillus sp. AY1]MDH4618439.1 hypothetical protein [Brevibacillus sp. AY1]
MEIISNVSNTNVIDIVMIILGWLIIVFLAYRMYRKQIVKPKVWTIPLMIIVGLFSLSMNWKMLETIVKVPILPLGVWILYFVFKGKNEKWQTYRSYAWLGFVANFIFFASTLLTIPLHHVIYPKDKLSVYISNVENASIINIHPSAKDRSLSKVSLIKQLDTMRQEAIYSDQWYNETLMNTESNKRNERFPYLLIGTSSKWGSGLHTLVYIEDDGKGILLSTPKRELYFRSQDSIMDGGE